MVRSELRGVARLFMLVTEIFEPFPKGKIFGLTVDKTGYIVSHKAPK